MTPTLAARGLLLTSLISGLLAAPLSATEFPADHVFAGSGGNDRVLGYSPNGKLQLAVGGATALEDPGALAFGPDGRFYVASRTTGRVYAFNPTGQLVATLGAFAGLGDPTAMTFTPEGDLLVADGDSNTLIQFNLDGELVQLFGDGLQIPDTRDLLFGPDGLLYVASASSAAVLVFAPDGTQVDTLGAGEGLSDPAALAFDTTGRLLISSGDADEIVILDRDGDVDERISLPGELDSPGGLGFLSTGALAVVSRGTDEVLLLDLAAEGAVLDSFGANLSDGWDLAVSPYRFKFTTKGDLVVAGESRNKLKQDGTLSIQPGSLQLMVELEAFDDEDGLEIFGSRHLVMHGYELAAGPGEKKRLYTGHWFTADTARTGSGSLSLGIAGKVSKKTGEFTVKKASGSLLRASADGVYVGSAKSGKRLK